MLVFRRGQLLEELQHRQTVAVELGLREAEPGDAIGFGEERREPFLDAAVGDERDEGGGLG